ncbi:MAG: Fertility inhibition FinO [Thiothrix sp.]|nr:Fertility inhibition FinO [Thiothrix sp.]HPE61951.1 ProQ/FINO family protein [Thiolinea sp.]
MDNSTTTGKRKPLSLPKKPGGNAAAGPLLSRSRRIIRREDVPADKLARPKSVPKPGPQARKPQPKPQKPVKSPSDLRADELDAALNGLKVWMERLPLSIGIEREIFQFIARHELSASKRVVQKLLYRHTRRGRYLQRLGAGEVRYHLDGAEAGPILPADREHVGRLLAVQQDGAAPGNTR